jgi:putative ABC transport system permease protein
MAAFLMRRWLDSYAFRIHLGPAIFVWSALLSVAITWLTVGSRVFTGANSNPVNALRD